MDVNTDIIKEVKSKDQAVERISTRHTGAKHVLPSMFAVLTDPKNYLEVTQSTHLGDWQKAIAAYIESIEANGT